MQCYKCGCEIPSGRVVCPDCGALVIRAGVGKNKKRLWPWLLALGVLAAAALLALLLLLQGGATAPDETTGPSTTADFSQETSGI